jgi:phage-related protein
MNILLLEKYIANGEYEERLHLSAHKSWSTVGQEISSLFLVTEMTGEDAPNRWEKKDYKTWEYRTGNWGYTSYRVTILEVTRHHHDWKDD